MARPHLIAHVLNILDDAGALPRGTQRAGVLLCRELRVDDRRRSAKVRGYVGIDVVTQIMRFCAIVFVEG